ncbi:MAG: molecular chaperone DnaK [Pseudonocardiales bacterium]|jgi:molecular chaperone DnaK (HSP70)|nr:molecular chaperone DnaK [Pseudonocardiales bacterium]
MHYQIGLDLGSTRTATATCREIPRLESVTPTVVFANPDGSLVIGEEAERRALADPGRVARRFLRRVGDPTPLRLGGVALGADVLTARFVTQLLAPYNGRVAVAHPASWGPHRLESLRGAGLSDVLFVPAPQAAVVAYDSQARLEPGSVVAVYDLGGSGFEAAVVRKLDSFVPAGRPEEAEVGGLDFDEAVFSHVVESLEWDSLDAENPVVRAAVADLRRACTAAKEQLSSDTEVRIPVAVPGISVREVRLTRAEFEEMIRPALAETTGALLRALENAGVRSGDLAAVLLVGGSARIPLVTQEVSALLGRSVTPAFEGMVAVGAALSARAREVAAPEVATVMWSRPPRPAAPALQRKRKKLTPYITAAVLAAAVGGGLAMNTYFASNATPDTTTTTTPPPTTTQETVAAVTTTTEAPVQPQKTVAPPPPPPPTKRTTTTTTWPSSSAPSVSKSTSAPAPTLTTKASTKAGAP